MREYLNAVIVVLGFFAIIASLITYELRAEAETDQKLQASHTKMQEAFNDLQEGIYKLADRAAACEAHPLPGATP